MYGFTLGHNKYNSLAFKVVLDFNKNNNQEEIKNPLEKEKSE